MTTSPFNSDRSAQPSRSAHQNRWVRPLAVALGTVALVTACGSPDRPSVDQISKAMSSQKIAGRTLDGDLARRVTDCTARAYHASKLSNEFLTALVEQDDDYDPSKEDKKIFESVMRKAVLECSGLGGSKPGDVSGQSK